MEKGGRDGALTEGSTEFLRTRRGGRPQKQNLRRSPCARRRTDTHALPERRWRRRTCPEGPLLRLFQRNPPAGSSTSPSLEIRRFKREASHRNQTLERRYR